MELLTAAATELNSPWLFGTHLATTTTTTTTTSAAAMTTTATTPLSASSSPLDSPSLNTSESDNENDSAMSDIGDDPSKDPDYEGSDYEDPEARVTGPRKRQQLQQLHQKVSATRSGRASTLVNGVIARRHSMVTTNTATANGFSTTSSSSSPSSSPLSAATSSSSWSSPSFSSFLAGNQHVHLASSASSPPPASVDQLASSSCDSLLGEFMGGDGQQAIHQCTVNGCTATFQSQEHLKRHMRKHTGEKPFQCLFPGCTKTFSRNDNMLQHLRTHAKVVKGKIARGPSGKLVPSSIANAIRETLLHGERVKSPEDDECMSSPSSPPPHPPTPPVLRRMSTPAHHPQQHQQHQQQSSPPSPGFHLAPASKPSSGVPVEATSGELPSFTSSSPPPFSTLSPAAFIFQQMPRQQRSFSDSALLPPLTPSAPVVNPEKVLASLLAQRLMMVQAPGSEMRLMAPLSGPRSGVTPGFESDRLILDRLRGPF